MNPLQPDDIRNRLLLARLPAMPQILIKLIELCQSDEAGVTELAELIANDPGMTGRVMRVANSAAYQRGGRQVNLAQALAVLGSDLVKSLLISESVFQTFNGFPHTGGSDLRAFWKHSLTAAVLARGLAKAMQYPQVEEAYLAGLLHDVGRLALLAAAPDIYRLNFFTPDHDHLCDTEQKSLHISHAEAGAWLIERWEMDSFLADAVLYHHEDPARVSAAHPLVRLVHLAHLLSDHPRGTPLPAEVGAVCQISDAELLEIYQGCEAQVMQAAEHLGIDLSGLPETVAAPQPPAEAAPINPVQQRLADEIRNRALTAELAQVFARQKGEGPLLESVRQNARMLFNLDDTAVFLLNSNGRTLVGSAVGEQRQRLAGFSITLDKGGLADAVLSNKLAFLERASSLTMPEEQLLRAFNAACLLCLPLLVGKRCLGLLVAGLEGWRKEELQGQEKFLQAFGNQAARALAEASQNRSEIDRRIASVQEDHLKNARKIVHEANNPLSIIKNYLGVLDDKLARQEPLGYELSILNEEIDRVGGIIKEFARVTPTATEEMIDVNKVISDIVRLFRESKFLPASVQISAVLPQQSSDIFGSTGVVKQIFVNLIKNAVEAMPEGGRIEVINNGVVQRAGVPYFALRIQDCGPGLPDTVVARLFQPVQSNKRGDNRGLGLNIVHGLVQKLQGSITCQSSALGTSFDILLPGRNTKTLVS